MFEVNIDYEVFEAKREEVSTEGNKKFALIRNGIVLALFDIDVSITDIECKGYEIARKTLRAENINLCYVIIEEKYPFNIIKKTIIQKDIVKEEFENYQVIGDDIYKLEEREAQDELWNFAENIFLDVLRHSDAYFEICNDIEIYSSCINAIYEQVLALYKNKRIVYTSYNSFILYGSYKDVRTTEFEDKTLILNKKTKKFIILEIESSDFLSPNAKKEIIERIKKY